MDAAQLTEDGALLAQALLRDPVLIRAIRSGDLCAVERATEPHGLTADEALVLLSVATRRGRN